MFEPTTLPTAMSPEPLRAAMSEVESSGVDVPKPTMVSPMKKADTPMFLAMATAPRTSNSAPPVRMRRETTSRTAESSTSDLACVPAFPPGHPLNGLSLRGAVGR